jgi:hypothetical protein
MRPYAVINGPIHVGPTYWRYMMAHRMQRASDPIRNVGAGSHGEWDAHATAIPAKATDAFLRNSALVTHPSVLESRRSKTDCMSEALS